MEAVVHRAGPADAAEVVDLIGLLAGENKEQTTLTRDYVLSFLDFPGNGILLAWVEAQCVGLLSFSLRPCLYHAAPSLVIEDLVVRPEHRGQGYGRLLVAEAIRIARTAGCGEVSVSTGLDNRKAQALYRHMGLLDESLLLEMHL